MLIYKLGDVLSRQNCSLKTASRIGNIIRKILFQNTNGAKSLRDDVVKTAKSVGNDLLATILGNKDQEFAYALVA